MRNGFERTRRDCRWAFGPRRAGMVVLVTVVLSLTVAPSWADDTAPARAEGVEPPDQTRTASLDQPQPQPASAEGVQQPEQKLTAPREQRQQQVVLSDDASVRLQQSRFHLDQMLHVPDWLHLGLNFRTRYESYSQPVKKNETTGASQFSERTSVQLAMRYKPFRFFSEFLDAQPLYNNGVTINNRMKNSSDLLQVYAGLGTDNFLGSGLPTELQVGKFTQDFGRRRLIARSQYNNVPYSFVGAHWTLGDMKDWNVRAFAMRPVNNQQTSPDKTDANTWFMGVSYLEQRLPRLHTELYAYYLTQRNIEEGTSGLNQDQSSQGQQPNLYSLGFRLFQPEARDAFDYEIESTYQFGRGALASGSKPLPVFAFYQHAEVGYTFALPWTPSFRVKYDYASGQRSPTDQKNGRFNTLYGAHNFEYTYSGIWGLFKRSNISSAGYLVSVEPAAGVKATFQQRFWWLAQSTDLFQGAQLQDQTGRAGNYLGSELDARVAYTVSSNMLLEGGWAYLVKGSYYSNLLKQGVPGSPNDKNTDYVFLSMRLFF